MINKKLPSSLEEKRATADDINDFINRRWLFVHEIQSILCEFKSDDWVYVNKVGNINVGRGDDPMIATIEMLWARIEYWGKEKEE
jgi:hypothetical protein